MSKTKIEKYMPMILSFKEKAKSYGLKDSWQSSAYYVNPFEDEMLKRCEINSYEELISILKGENNG